ncbi:MAG: imidazole glycerol phosphate synthase subunit HisH [Ponticaulis sp.]|nr:imidazole glycerol phosphate synthase subunit HisH [Ponticaulis sp.]|tara:strand:- start:3671 stop:4312 length:642 start_codon:yes stop_codon:yes gene_type:complete
MQTLALIDYGAGNIPSATRALEVAIERSGVPVRLIVTNAPDEVASADRIVIPGVGHFRDCRNGLFSVDGLADAVEDVVRIKSRPTLGICVGMQLMASSGLEDGETDGLGWIPGKVAHIPTDKGLPVPHMGWNELKLVSDHPVLAGLADGDHAYFVHSYHFQCDHASHLMATTDYGSPVTAAIGRDNLFGTQFHPELSQNTGLKLLTNWINWAP